MDAAHPSYQRHGPFPTRAVEIRGRPAEDGSAPPHPQEAFTTAEAELLAAAHVLIGDPASGLSRAADRTLWRHISAHARQDEPALAQAAR
ncbi:hypothetical protein [Kitasatospora sp. NPDC089509]|uniref:hypothetical protein n=1 Tax=Kitasatospora sp. NPDC089509 TaxID=3364079 RepID=UPI003812A5A2